MANLRLAQAQLFQVGAGNGQHVAALVDAGEMTKAQANKLRGKATSKKSTHKATSSKKKPTAKRSASTISMSTLSKRRPPGNRSRPPTVR